MRSVDCRIPPSESRISTTSAAELRVRISAALFWIVFMTLALTTITSCDRRTPAEPEPWARGAAAFDQPTPVITYGPPQNGVWGTRVEFKWTEDPPAAGRELSLLNTNDYFNDTGEPNIQLDRLLAWVDTLTYYPLPGGGYDPDSFVWRPTEQDTVLFPAVQSTTGAERIIFAVRSYDAGGERAPLGVPENVRLFRVVRDLNGPTIVLRTSFGDCVTSADSDPGAVIFRSAVRFEWEARDSPYPGGWETVQTWWGFGEPDTTWTLSGPTSGSYPPENEAPWIPDPGLHTVHVRAINDAGLQTVVSYDLDVRTFRSHGVLAVLDTDPDELQAEGIWPIGYELIERVLVRDHWLAGRALSIHETHAGSSPLDADHLKGASTIVWFHGADLAGGGSSALQQAFTHDSKLRSLLSTWHEAGGNLVLCGLNPVNAMRYFTSATDCEQTYVQSDPVVFSETLSDSTLLTHFAATRFGADLVEMARGRPLLEPQEGRLTTATSVLPWLPDLEFDPTTWPDGPLLRGFGLWDEGVNPRGDAVVAYTANSTSSPIAILVLRGSRRRGNAFYLGLHPYFVGNSQVAEMFGAILDAFGELRLEDGPAPEAH